MSLPEQTVASAVAWQPVKSPGPSSRHPSKGLASRAIFCGANQEATKRMTRTYRYISADSHMEIDSKWWIDRVPTVYRDQAPRVVHLPDGSDAWLVEGAPLRQVPFDLYGGKGRDVWKPWGQNYATTPGTGPAEQRIKEQDQDG